METLRELIDSCTWEYMKTYSRLKILGGSLEVLGEDTGVSGSGSIAVIVKSVKEISFDEIPLFNAIISALSTYNITPRFYEYDMIAEGRGRYEELARVLVDSIEGGDGGYSCSAIPSSGSCYIEGFRAYLRSLRLSSQSAG
jgi:hypothetical protein